MNGTEAARTAIKTIVADIAPTFDLPPRIVEAVISVESNWQIYAWNPEPRYRWLWDVVRKTSYRLSSEQAARKEPPKDFPVLAGDRDQEWWGQQASWGLLQIMGANARWLGYEEPYLPALCEPHVNIEYGCRLLAYYAEKFFKTHGWRGVFMAYNGGPYAVAHNTNPDYADKIVRALGVEGTRYV